MKNLTTTQVKKARRQWIILHKPESRFIVLTSPVKSIAKQSIHIHNPERILLPQSGLREEAILYNRNKLNDEEESTSYSLGKHSIKLKSKKYPPTT